MAAEASDDFVIPQVSINFHPDSKCTVTINVNKTAPNDAVPEVLMQLAASWLPHAGDAVPRELKQVAADFLRQCRRKQQACAAAPCFTAPAFGDDGDTDEADDAVGQEEEEEEDVEESQS
jgi:hypothetical protein